MPNALSNTEPDDEFDGPIDPVELYEARRELELLRREKELLRENAIEFAVPHPKQVLFFLSSYYKFRYARTGNRFGKSEMGAMEDIAFALGYRPWVPVGTTVRSLCPLIDIHGNVLLEIEQVPEAFRDADVRTLGLPSFPTKGIIVTADWDKSTEVFTEREGENLGKLFKYIPKHALGTATKNHSGAIDRIPVKHISGGWSVIHLDTIKSYKQNPLAFESSVWDWAHIDEPCPEGLWKALVRGLTDRGGKAWFTCTPITEPWIDTEFVPDIQAQSLADMPAIRNDKLSRFMMTGSMDDNPYLSPEDIETTLSWYTPEERDARRRGIPLAYSGIIYREFDWTSHVMSEPPLGWKNWSTPPPNYCLRFAIDYHPAKPHHVLFIATSPFGYSYVYAEIWRSCLMSDLVTEIKSVLGREPTVPGVIDPLASTPNQVTDVTPMQEVMQNGLPVIPATKDPLNGIIKVKELLTSSDRLGTRLLRFAPQERLPRCIFEISRGFQWDEDRNKPAKKNDDAMENLYRLALQGLDYVEPDEGPAIQPRLPDFSSDSLSLPSFADGDFSDAAARRARIRNRYRR